MIGVGNASGWHPFQKVVSSGGDEPTRWIDEPRAGENVIVARYHGDGSLQVGTLTYAPRLGWGAWQWWTRPPPPRR